MEIELTKSDGENFKRLDHFLVAKLITFSRNVIKGLVEKGQIFTADNGPLYLNKMPPVGTIINLNLPAIPLSQMEGEDIPLNIVYEDEHLLVVNKPAGMATHPAPGTPCGTLANGLLHYYPPIAGVGPELLRPGIVHRLDMGTAGLLVVAKNTLCYRRLITLFKTHTIRRTYQGIALGKKIPIGGKLVSTIGKDPKNYRKRKINVSPGKEAITHYSVEEYFSGATHLNFKLVTGRTHQIRLHASSILKTPILGDTLYGLGQSPPRCLQNCLKEYPYPMLYAKELGFMHPITKEELFFTIAPPEIFAQCLQILKNDRPTLT